MVLTKAQEIDVKKISQEVVKECLIDKTFMETFAYQISEIVAKNLRNEFEKINKKVDALETRINNIEEINKTLISENKELVAKLNILEEQMSKECIPGVSENSVLQSKVNNLEQNAKLLELRVFRVPESPNENLKEILVNIFYEKLGISSCQIDNCYRIGLLNQNSIKTRPIIVKFGSMSDRNNVFYNKKKLKGNKIVIAEELIKPRFELLKLAKEKFGTRNVWSKEGSIVTKLNGKKYYMKNVEDLNKILDN